MTSTGSQTFISLPGAAGSGRRENSGSGRAVHRPDTAPMRRGAECTLCYRVAPLYQTCQRVEYDTSTDERGLLGPVIGR